MKNIQLTVFLLLFFFSSYAQSTHIIRANFFTPGISSEHRLFKNTTISGDISLAPRFLFSTSMDQFDYYLGMNPKAEIRYNHYLNFDKRQQRGRNICQNSGNYLTAGLAWEINAGINIMSEGFNSNTGGSTLSLPFAFGIQRSISSKIYYNILLGGSYSFYYSNIQPLLNFKIGYTIFEKK